MTKHTEVSFSRRDHMTWHADIKQQTCSCENTARWLLVKCAFYVNCLVQWYFARTHTPSKLMNYDVTANTESRGAHVQLAHSCTCTQTRVMKAHRQIKQNDMKKMSVCKHFSQIPTQLLQGFCTCVCSWLYVCVFSSHSDILRKHLRGFNERIKLFSQDYLRLELYIRVCVHVHMWTRVFFSHSNIQTFPKASAGIE